MNLSIPTLAASSLMSCIVLSLAIAAIAYRRSRVLWVWALALALLAFGLALVTQRGQWGSLLSVVTAHTLFAIAFSMFTHSVYVMQQRVFARLLLAWLPFTVALVGFYWVGDSLAQSQLLGGVLVGVQALWIVWALVQRRAQTQGRGQYLLMLGFCLVVLVCLALMMATLIQVNAIATLVTGLVALMLFATGMPLMVLESTQHGLDAVQQELAELNITDSLTGLANRKRLDEFLATEWARARRTAQPVALLMIDVDFFKKFNDHYGHQAGDDCLIQIAGVLRAGARRPSDLVARFAGEEFVVVAANTTSAQALELAELLRCSVAALEIPHFESTHDKVTVSIGVAALVPQEDKGREALIKQSDAALSRVQGAGGNRVGEWQA